jgi:hypothetical protein
MRRLTGMLGRKGYSASLAFRVVRQELEAAGHGDVDPGGDPGGDLGLEMDDEPAS